MTQSKPPANAPLNQVLKIILAAILVVNGLLLAPILPGQMAQIMFALVIGLVAMALLLSGVRGLSSSRGLAQSGQDKANGN